MLSYIDVGLCAVFEYPRHNIQGVHSSTERRRIRITAVRDLNAQPLDSQTLRTQPLLRRGSVLVTGWDFDRQAERSFYLESMSNLETVAPDRLVHVVGDGYSNDYAVCWIETDDDWLPSDDDLPDEFRVTGILIDGISGEFAETIAGKANQEYLLLESRGRWAIVFPPGYFNPPRQ